MYSILLDQFCFTDTLDTLILKGKLFICFFSSFSIGILRLIIIIVIAFLKCVPGSLYTILREGRANITETLYQ